MEFSLQNQKLVIPSRKYNAGQSPLKETAIAFNPPSNFYDEKKFTSTKPPQQIPQFTAPFPQLTQIQVPLTLGNSSVLKQTFKEIQKNIRRSLENNVKVLTEQYQTSLSILKNQAEIELNDLKKLKTSLLSQFSNKNKESPDLKIFPPAKIENFETNSSKSGISMNFQSKNPGHFLLSQLGDSVFVSKDLEQVEKLNLPTGFSRGSNVMILNEKEILLVFERGFAYILNIFTQETKKIMNTKLKKSFFGLAFIGNTPAVIGGLDKESKICFDSVEILVNSNHWVDGNKLNEARSHCHAIKHGYNTYVFGGFSKGYLFTVEKHKYDWVLLPVQIPNIMTNFALGSKDTKIYIFGGENTSEFLQDVYMFNSVTPGFTVANQMKNGFCNKTNGCVKFVDGTFLLLDAEEEKIFKYIP